MNEQLNEKLEKFLKKKRNNNTNNGYIKYKDIIEENEQFDIIQIEPSFEGDKDSDKNNGDDKEKGKKKKKGVNGFVIFLIVLLVLIIIAVIVLLVIKYTKKTVTSEDIEKNIKTPTPIVN